MDLRDVRRLLAILRTPPREPLRLRPVLDDADRRRLAVSSSVTAALMGDPPPWRSALGRRQEDVQ